MKENRNSIHPFSGLSSKCSWLGPAVGNENTTDHSGEGRSQGSGVRSQKSGVRRQKTEDRRNADDCYFVSERKTPIRSSPPSGSGCTQNGFPVQARFILNCGPLHLRLSFIAAQHCCMGNSGVIPPLPGGIQFDHGGALPGSGLLLPEAGFRRGDCPLPTADCQPPAAER